MTERSISSFSGVDPFAAFVRDFFTTGENFYPAGEFKLSIPVDQYVDSTGYHFEFALPGVGNLDGIKISVENGNELRVQYQKEDLEEDPNTKYVQHKITRRSFNLGWVIPSKFDCSKIAAKLKDGLLKIDIPISEASLPRTIDIISE